MGILRTDRVAGLGGANAIKGSTKFHGDLNYQGNYLSTEDSNDFNLGSGDFTIEAWIYASALSSNNFEGIIGQWPASGANANNSWVLEIVARDLEFYYCYDGANLVGPIQGGTVKENEWTHVMATRSGNTMYMFVNGTAHNNSGQSVTHTFNDSTYDVTIGGYIATAAMWKGNISNVRVIKGTALHTSNFTVPTNELVKTSDTVLLACQSSADILKEATGKIITPRRNNSNSSYPTATKFTPNSPVGFSTTTDVGTQFGSTFDGVTTFDSQAYMVPPSGNTRERNRGRGVYMLGYNGTPSAGNSDRIDYINIQSQGNSIRFGSLTTNRYTLGAGANSTRCLFTGGYQEGHSPDTDVNTIEFVTIASEGDATDFGDRTQVGRLPACASNDTRCVMASAKTGAGNQDTIDFVTIATTGNATGFGDLTSARTSMCMSCNSTTRGIFSGGYQPSPVNAAINTIEFITFATTGNGTNFGDLTSAAQSSSGGTASSSTRGLIGLGFVSPARVNTIDFVTIASTGDASDFGDLTLVRQAYGSVSNSTRGVFLGGSDPYTNTIDFVLIASTGDATEFGDVSVTQSGNGAAGSDSHGGLS